MNGALPLRRVLFAFLIYAGISFFYLDKYPCAISDEATYSEPSYNLLASGHLSLHSVPPEGGFDRSSIIQHGKIFCGLNAAIFRFFGVSLRTARLQSFLAGLA